MCFLRSINALKDQVPNHADELGLRSDRGGAHHLYPHLLTQHSGLRVEVIQYFHVTGNEPNRLDDHTVGWRPKTLRRQIGVDELFLDGDLDGSCIFRKARATLAGKSPTFELRTGNPAEGNQERSEGKKRACTL